MAVRYNISFKSFPHDGTSKDYILQIHDNEFSGTAQDIKGNAEGLNINWRGDTQNPFPEMIPSSLTYVMRFRSTETDKYNFIEDLVSAQEERFFIRVYRDGGYWWQGFILIDEGSHQDYPFVDFRISAVDGIARLRNMDYRDKANDTSFTGRETLLQHLYHCIDLINMDFPGLTTSPRLRTNIPWFSEGMPTGGESCLGLTTLSHSVFTYTDTNGNEKYTSAWEVLRNLAGLFGASFYFSDGGYWLMNKERYKNSPASQEIYKYGSNMSYIGKESIDITTVIGVNDRFKVAKMNTLYLPPLAQYCVEYNHKTNENLATGVFFSDAQPVERTLYTNLNIPTDSDTRVKIKLKIRTRSNIILPVNLPDFYPIHRYYFRFKINAGDNYLGRSGVEENDDFFELEDTELAWGTEPYFTIKSRGHYEGHENNDVFTEFNFETPPIPESATGGNLSIQMQLIEVLDNQENTPPQNGELSGGPAFDWDTSLIDVRLENEEFTAARPSKTLRVFCAESDQENNTQKRSISLLMGDGPVHFSDSRLEYDDSPTEGWKIIDQGSTYQDISALNASTRLSMQKRALEVLNGTIMGADIEFGNRLDFDDKRYYFLSATFSAFYERWTGSWALAQTDTGVIVLPPNDAPDELEGFSVGSGIADNTIQQSVSAGDFGVIGGNSQDVKLQTNQLAKYMSANRSGRNYPAIVNKGGGQNQIFVNEMPEVFITAGTKFWLVNAFTGLAETLTASSDYTPNDSTLDIDEDLERTYPEGSYILLQNTSSPNEESVCQIQKGLNQTGTRFDITVTNFPSDDAEIDTKVELLRQGVNVLYEGGYTIDRSGAVAQIVFDFPLRGEHFVLKVCNDAAEWVEKVENFSGTELTITAGSLADVVDFDFELKVVKDTAEIFKDFADGYTVDIANNKIIFANRARGENIFIKKK